MIKYYGTVRESFAILDDDKIFDSSIWENNHIDIPVGEEIVILAEVDVTGAKDYVDSTAYVVYIPRLFSSHVVTKSLINIKPKALPCL